MKHLRNSLLLTFIIFLTATSINFGQDKSSSSLPCLALEGFYTVEKTMPVILSQFKE